MRFLRLEARALWSALIFFTRLPLPCLRDFSGEDMRRAATYFPVVGWVVGLVAAGTFIGARSLFEPGIAAGLSLACTALLTGAMHEDGFADVCDGFGGGTSREKILSIMQDSRVGTYGVLGVLLLIGLKWRILQSLPEETLPGLCLCSQVLSRGLSISLMATLDYARPDGPSKARPLVSKLSGWRLLAIGLLGLPTLLFLKPGAFWIIPALLLLRQLSAGYFKRRIGGYTGDCLGAVQQLGELLILLMGVSLQ